jgi:hypothetical protein
MATLMPSLTLGDLVAAMWPDENPLRWAARVTTARIFGHRLRKFGFEDIVNGLSTRELIAISYCVFPHQTAALVKVAYARAKRDNDRPMLVLLGMDPDKEMP